MFTMVVLAGKTASAKQRIKQLGADWIHIRAAEKVFFSFEKGPWHLFESLVDVNRHGSEVVWIHEKHDSDFVIVKWW